jgi:hypothetical protein
MASEARAVPQPNVGNRAALTRLEADGLVEKRGESHRTSRTFQRAMAKAAATLYREGDPGDDLRLPIALALSEFYPSADDEAVAALVAAMLPVELRSLGLLGMETA